MDNRSRRWAPPTAREALHSQRKTYKRLSLPLGETISSEIREAFRTGHARPEQKLALCAGGMPVPPEERVELLAILAFDSDAAIAERAKNATLSVPLASFLTALSQADADPRLFEYCAEYLNDKP